MKIINVIIIFASVLTFCGCLGTYHTRNCTSFNTNEKVAFFGSYPYKAIVVDMNAIQSKDEYLGGLHCLMGFISIPLDAVIDTIFIPGDLIAWPFGFSKSRPPDGLYPQ